MINKKNRSGVERVLVAEDSPVQAEQMRAILEESGYDVEVAGDGRQALAAAQENPPHLVISDVTMPEMDGYDFCRALKADPALKDIPFMLVTSLSAPVDVIHGLDCGADNFITKPYQEDILLDRVRYLLTNRALRGTSRVRSGVEIELGGKVHFVSAERQQILDLLISTYAEAVRLSEEAARRGEQLRESYDIMAVLQRSAEGFNRVYSQSEVVAEALACVQDLPFCRASWILLLDEEGDGSQVASAGFDQSGKAALTAGPACSCQRDIRSGGTSGVTQVTDCPRLRQAFPSSDIAVHASVPLVGQQRAFGVLNIVARGNRPLAPDELRIVSGLGSQISAALDRAYLNATLERKVVERTSELRRSREHLALAQSIGGVGSAEYDLVTGALYWSDETYTIYGLDPHAQKADLEFMFAMVHPEDRAMLREMYEKARQGFDVEPSEYRMIRPDGRLLWIRRHAHIQRDAQGKPVSLMVTIHDITARKTAEEDIRRSHQHLARIQRITEIGSVEVDLETRTVFWSDEVYRLLGVDASSVTPSGDALIEAALPEDRAALSEKIRLSRAGEDVAPVEFRVRRADGSIRWFHGRSELVRDSTSRAVKVYATIYDVTRIKAAEDESRQSREHLALAQRVGNIGSCAVDLRSGDTFWSDELYRMYGVGHDTPRTFDTILALTHPDDRPALMAANNRSLQGADVEPMEFRIVRADGETRWLARQAQVIRDSQNRPTTLLITNQDITASKKVQLEREQLEGQLRQAQKMEAVGQLTGGIAHDFNNILAVIIGNLDLLKMEVSQGSEADTLVDTAVTACLKGSDLTKSLLAFSRRQPLQPKKIAINKLLQDSVKMLSRAIGEVIQVDLRLGDGIWDVLIDPSQLESALLNMMVNSRDAMPNGGHIVVETRNVLLDEAYASQNAEVTPGEYVVIEVGDDGTGMSPEVLRRVFEPFFTTKEKGKGTGLGLAMVFGFVKQSGGHIKIYSEVGYGTTIRIYLPRVDDSKGAAPVEGNRAPAVAQGAHDEMILVVEDNPAVLRAVSKQLKSAGYRVVEAESAVKAIEMLSGGLRADLIFTDVIMPGGVTGADLAREAARHWPATKVLLTSGFPEGLLENGNKLPSGVNLLSKPYRMEELLRKLRDVLDAQT